MKRLFWHPLHWFLVLTIVFSSFLATGPVVQAAKNESGGSFSQTELSVENSGLNGLELVLDVHSYALMPGETGWQLSVPGLAQTSRPGEPQMPFASALIGVPPGATVRVEVLAEAHEVAVAGRYRLAAAPAPALLGGETAVAAWQPATASRVYQANQDYPGAAARLVDDAWLRDLRLARVEIYPFQYNPVSGALLWRPHLRVAVHFEGVEPPAAPAPLAFDPFDAVFRQAVLNYDVARQWRSAAQEAVDPYSLAAVAQQASGPRYKITTDRDGIYRLSYAALESAGLDVETLDPRQFRLTSQWQDVAIFVAGEEDGDFTADEYILFYGQKFAGGRMASMYPEENRNWYTYTQQLDDGSFALWRPEFNADMAEKYTDETVYWLTVEEGTWPRMTAVNGAPAGSTAPMPETFIETIHTERSQYSRMPLPLAEDDWYYLETAGVGTFSYTTTLPSVANTAYTATIQGIVASYYSNDSGSPDHHTRFRFNTYPTPLDDDYWDGKSAHYFSAEIPQAALLNGVNTLYMDTYNDALVSYPRFLLDWFDVTYQRRFQAVSDRLLFRGESDDARRYQVYGLLGADVQVYDISTPFAPQQVLAPGVVGSGGSYTVTFAVTSSLAAQYLVIGPTAILTPKNISFYDPPDLRSAANGADYLFIAPSELLTATQQIADYRATKGYDTQVVTLTDVVQEFNDGIFHPIAIKNFLAYTFDTWDRPPTYVTLVGDGSHDWKRFNPALYGTGSLYMPPNQAWVDPWQGDTDATNALATVVGTDVLPDVIIGRMSANNITQLLAISQKTEDYEAEAWQSWQQHLLFAADNTDNAGNFEQTANTMIANHIESGFTADKVYVSQYCSGTGSCPAVGTAFVNQLNNTGAMFVDYNGHGAPSSWASEYVMRTTFISSLANGEHLPILLSMTCLDGFWFRTSLPSLAEEMVRAPGKGAVATFSPTGLGLATGHDALQEGFLGAVFQQGEWTLGPAALAAKLNLYATGGNYDLIQTYVIFGDPALRIPDPYTFIVGPAAASQTALAGQQVAYTLAITNTGVLTDTFEIAVDENAWPVTVPVIVGPLPAGMSAIFTATVDIPADVVGGSMDIAQVHMVSQGDHSERTQIPLFTTGHTYSLTLSGPQAKIGLPGTTLDYTMTVTNTGSLPDAYDIILGAHTWTVNAPGDTGSLAPGSSAAIVVSVDIPTGAANFQNETLPVTLSSQALPAKTASTTLATTARTYGVTVTPGSSAAQGMLGETVTYTLQVFNTSPYVDSFDVTVSDNAWPVTPGAASLGPLAPGQGAALTVSVHIPTGIPGGTVDEALIGLSSQHDPNQSDTALLATTSQVYGLTVWPAQAAQVALPGSLVTYTLHLTNTSSTTDTFSIAPSASAWQTSVAASTGPLVAGESTSIPVNVQIPAGANEFDVDTVVLTFTSQTDPERLALVQLDTTARLYGVQLSPPTDSRLAYPGQTVTYTLMITNTGGFADTFTVTVAGAAWPTTAAPAPLGPLSPGQTTQLSVAVTIPFPAPGVMADTAVVTVVSQGSPAIQAASTLTTRSGYRVYLPLVRK